MLSKTFGKRMIACMLAAIMALPGLIYLPEKTAAKESTGEESTLSYLLHNLEDYQREETDGQALVPTTRQPVTGVTPAMPAEGDVNTLVIITEFEDAKFTPEFKEGLKERIFMDQTESDPEKHHYPRDSVRAYYQRSSYGKLNIGGEFIEFCSDHERSWYNSEYGNNDILYQAALDDWAEKILSERPDTGETDLEYLNRYLSRFDLDGDLEIDGCYLACAGGNTGWGTQWWSTRTGATVATLGDYHLNHIIQVVDCMHEEAGQDDLDDTISTFIHETGHQLGLDDYYSYGENGVDKFDSFAMMNNNTGDQDGLAKMLLDWIPEENVQIVTEDSPVTLRPFAATGDIAIILPKEEYDTYGIYSQFILAEYYKDEGNDHITEADGPDFCTIGDSIRLFHVYARLNEDRTAFLATNCDDDKLPMISLIRNKDRASGFYFPGDELTQTTTPGTAFYSDFWDFGLFETAKLSDSGIAITDITEPSENGTMSFQVSFSDTSSGPKLVYADLFESSGEPYIRAVFDQPVNPMGGGPVIYDRNPDGSYDREEQWGEPCEVRKTLNNLYSNEKNVVYFILEEGSARNTPGVLVIPKGTVCSSTGLACPDQTVEVSLVPEYYPELTVSVPGGNYDGPQTITISGAPEDTAVYYTLDGTEPTTDSLVYDGSITISGAVTLKAAAFYPDGFAGTKRLRESYTFQGVTLNRDALTLDLDETFWLKNTCMWDGYAQSIGAAFKSSDISTVYVDRNGKLLARKEGTATITASYGEMKATCVVTVKAGAAEAVKKALKETYGAAAGERMRELSDALNGKATLQEFAELGYLTKPWIGGIDDVLYAGTPGEVKLAVYDGLAPLEEETDYTASYKNNTDAGEATVTVSLLGERKGQAPLTGSFIIRPAILGSTIYPQDMGVKYDGKAHKPVPVMIDDWNGVAFMEDPKELTIIYYDSNMEKVKSVKEPGHYYADIYSNSKNYTGSFMVNVYVQKKNVVEKLKVKKLTKKFKYSGEPIEPVYGKDYKIKLPKGYINSAKEWGGTLMDQDLTAEYYDNVWPGKMTMVLKADPESPYKGTQIVTFKIR